MNQQEVRLIQEKKQEQQLLPLGNIPHNLNELARIEPYTGVKIKKTTFGEHSLNTVIKHLIFW